MMLRNVFFPTFTAYNNACMYIIRNVLVSDDVIEQQFLCNLEACKGACCWEGDYGAPLLNEELEILNRIYPAVKPFLSPAGIAELEKTGRYEYLEDQEEFSTPLIDGGPCAYITYNEGGIALCGLEQAFLAGATDFRKPLSCHLYPIRARKEEAGFDVLNYERWSICSPACEAGAKARLPVFRFVKDALIRKYGQGFYEELEAAATAAAAAAEE